MRHLPVFAALLLASASAFAIDAPIRSVVVYNDSAMVTRDVQLAPGKQRIEVQLTPNFDSTQLRVEADDGVRTGPLSIKDETQTIAADPKAALLAQRIQELEDQKTTLEADSAASTDVLQMIGSIKEKAGERDFQKLEAARLTTYLGEIRKASASARKTMQDNNLLVRKLDTQIWKLRQEQSELPQEGRQSSRQTRTLSFDVASDSGGKVSIIYPQSGASWAPMYRATLDTRTGRVQLQRRAQLRQRTGEDWSKVALRVSTSQQGGEIKGDEPVTWEVGLMPRPRPGEGLYDSDGDGVPDSQDTCPNVPAGTRVDASGCAVTPSSPSPRSTPPSTPSMNRQCRSRSSPATPT